MSKDVKYLVGDVVRIIRANSGYYNHTGEITSSFVNGDGDRMYYVSITIDLSKSPLGKLNPFYEDDLELVESVVTRTERCVNPPANEYKNNKEILQELQAFIDMKNNELQLLTRFHSMYLMLLERYQSRLHSSETDQKAIMDLKIQNNNYAIVFEMLGLKDVDAMAKKILDLQSQMKSS